MSRGNLFVISGPSGAGKGTLVARLLKTADDFWVSISATTRSPRAGEVNGVHYYFVTDAEFDDLILKDELLEWAQYANNRYGTPKETVLEQIAQNKQVILEIEMQGAFQIKERLPEAHLIFVEPPSLEVLESRLRNRGTDSEESIQMRLNTAKLELSRKMEYDIQLVNDDINLATQELIAVVDSFR